jgi:spore coat protein I
MEKRTRELKKVQTFIRKKQKKSGFESAYLQVIPKFLDEATKISQKMHCSCYEELRKEAILGGNICHGEYTQHNVLFNRRELILTNFEHAHLDLQCVDIALFLRKVMEKQGWKVYQGEKFLHSYEVVRPLKDVERQVLALRLSYPEKLWKLANHYYHTNKAWIPEKNLEKLKTFVNQQKERERFVCNVF